ncbi:MAG: tetratricopeptide repeat protein [Methylocella sp.]
MDSAGGDIRHGAWAGPEPGGAGHRRHRLPAGCRQGGLPKNDEEALRLYKRAAGQGYAGGQTALGFFYETGRDGLPKNKQEAARLYKRAAGQGDAYARSALRRLGLH